MQTLSVARLLKITLCCALIVGAALFLNAHLFYRHFETCDDTVMMLIASGKSLTARPDEHLIFMSVFVGRILRWLYTLSPNVPWYGYYLTGAIYLAMTAISVCLWLKAGFKIAMQLFMLFFLTAGLYFVNELQFSAAALLISTAGLSMAILAIEYRTAKTSNWIWLFSISLVLITFGALIRSKCSLLIAVLGLSYASILFFGNNGKSISEWRKADNHVPALFLAGWAFFSCCIAVSVQQLDDWYYSVDPAWAQVQPFEKLKNQLVDYGYGQYSPNTAMIFQDNGWTQNDREMLQGFFFVDCNVFTISKMHNVIERTKQFREVSLKSVREIFHIIRTDPRLLSIGLTILVFTILLKRNFLVRMCLGTILILGTILVITILFKMEARIYIPLFSALELLALFAVAENSKKIDPLFATSCVLLLLLILSPYQFQLYKKLGDQYWRERNTLVLRILPLLRSSQNLYIVWGNSLPLHGMSPFETCDEFSGIDMIVSPFWHTPFARNKLKSYGFLPCQSFVEKRCVLITRGWNQLETLRTHLLEHHQLALRVSEHRKIEDVDVWQLTDAHQITPSTNVGNR